MNNQATKDDREPTYGLDRRLLVWMGQACCGDPLLLRYQHLHMPHTDAVAHNHSARATTWCHVATFMPNNHQLSWQAAHAMAVTTLASNVWSVWCTGSVARFAEALGAKQQNIMWCWPAKDSCFCYQDEVRYCKQWATASSGMYVQASQWSAQ